LKSSRQQNQALSVFITQTTLSLGILRSSSNNTSVHNCMHDLVRLLQAINPCLWVLEIL